uniref:Uncharacterized protein n=1 Tax=Sphaerodactylus townsendi TaxID=933632 RepID=A0ACB8E550_9SAUR
MKNSCATYEHGLQRTFLLHDATWICLSSRANGNLSWNEDADNSRGREVSRDFAKLYELDGDPERKKFLDDLFVFMQKRGRWLYQRDSAEILSLAYGKSVERYQRFLAVEGFTLSAQQLEWGLIETTRGTGVQKYQFAALVMLHRITSRASFPSSHQKVFSGSDCKATLHAHKIALETFRGIHAKLRSARSVG